MVFQPPNLPLIGDYKSPFLDFQAAFVSAGAAAEQVKVKE
jgi:hypothetical protein